MFIIEKQCLISYTTRNCINNNKKPTEQHPQFRFRNCMILCQKPHHQNNCKTFNRTSKLSAHLYIRPKQHPQRSYILHTCSLMGNTSEWLRQLFRLILFIVWIKPRKNGSGEPDERCQERCCLCLWPDPYPLMQYLFGGLILFVRARNYISPFFFLPSKN